MRNKVYRDKWKKKKTNSNEDTKLHKRPEKNYSKISLTRHWSIILKDKILKLFPSFSLNDLFFASARTKYFII